MSLSGLPHLEQAQEVFLTVRLLLGRDETWADKGYCIGMEQFAVPVAAVTPGVRVASSAAASSSSGSLGQALVVRENKGRVEVVGPDSLLAVCTATGQILEVKSC